MQTNVIYWTVSKISIRSGRATLPALQYTYITLKLNFKRAPDCQIARSRCFNKQNTLREILKNIERRKEHSAHVSLHIEAVSV